MQTGHGSDPLFDFPVALSVKAMGRNRPGFEARVRALVDPVLAPDGLTAVTTRRSRQGNYLSVRLHFTALDRRQLESVYRVLQADEQVLYTL